MECDICARDGKNLAEIGMHCASCARTAIYTCRLDYSRTLLEKASLAARFDQITHHDEVEGSRRLGSVWKAELLRVQAAEIRDRIQLQSDSSAMIRKEIEEMRKDIATRKGELAQKRAHMRKIKGTLAGQDKGQMLRLNDISARGSKSFKAVYDISVSTRVYLCREAATLLRLRQRKTRTSDRHREHYLIAGWKIPDLRQISACKCTELTAMLATYSHLLCLVAFYLGVRLPAEITLPRRDYPLATINTPSTSYTSTKAEFPGSGSLLAMTEHSKKNEHKGLSRPRPLFIGSDDRADSVSHVAKRDPSAFKYFVEAISLLAWDVSWLMHSQGFVQASDSWTEACDLGRNLWFLIFSPQQSPALLRAMASRDGRQRQSAQNNIPPPDAQGGRLGESSHTSTYNFLGTADRLQQSRAFRLSSYKMISDPLRRLIETEMKNAEWEVLGQDEINDGGETFEEAIIVRAQALDGKAYDETRSIVATRAQLEQANDRPKGTSGWTKVKDKNRVN
jgi:hypothetical protein